MVPRAAGQDDFAKASELNSKEESTVGEIRKVESKFTSAKMANTQNHHHIPLNVLHYEKAQLAEGCHGFAGAEERVSSQQNWRLIPAEVGPLRYDASGRIYTLSRERKFGDDLASPLPLQSQEISGAERGQQGYGFQQGHSCDPKNKDDSTTFEGKEAASDHEEKISSPDRARYRDVLDNTEVKAYPPAKLSNHSVAEEPRRSETVSATLG